MPPPPDDHNGVIRYYSLILTETDTGVDIHVEVETMTEVVYSLHPFYTYEVIVSAVTIASGPYTSPVTVQLPEDGVFMFLYY